MIQQAVRTLALASSDVSDAIGTRMHPGRKPQNTALPTITYLMGGPTALTLSGTSGKCQATLDAVCWDNNYADARSLADDLRAALDGATGSENSTNVYDIIHETADDDDVDPVMGDDEGVWGVRISFTVYYQEM